jgi:hypothetical protein
MLRFEEPIVNRTRFTGSGFIGSIAPFSPLSPCFDQFLQIFRSINFFARGLWRGGFAFWPGRSVRLLPSHSPGRYGATRQRRGSDIDLVGFDLQLAPCRQLELHPSGYNVDEEEREADDGQHRPQWGAVLSPRDRSIEQIILLRQHPTSGGCSDPPQHLFVTSE